MTTQPTELFAAKLTRHDEIAPGVFVIGFQRRHDFLPGQAIKLGVDSKNPPRIYSICSGNQDDELCVLFNIKTDGFLTPKLAEQDQLPKELPYYICGQATMAVETRDLLIEKGIPFANIVTEIYF